MTFFSPFARAACAAAALSAMAVASPAGAQAPPPPPVAASDRQDRIEELEAQLMQATAENEALQLELRRTRQEVERLSRIVADLAAAQDALDAVQAQRGASSQTPDGVGGPSAPPSPPAASATAGSLGTIPASAVPQDAAAAYASARDFLFNNQLPQAQAAFEAFLANHPTAEDAPEARYWYAFTLLGQGAYTEAAQGFLIYLQEHGSDQSPRARGPDALVRLGIALAGAGRAEQACAAFRDLGRRYPNAPRTTRDLAAQQARRNACPA